MDNLGRAIYMAGFAMLFVFASSISVFLYSSLFNYLKAGTESTRIVNRAESATASEDLRNFKREITSSEIWITLYNMEQMHVRSIRIIVPGKYDDSLKVTREDVNNQNNSYAYANFVSHLNSNPNTLYTYSSQPTENGMEVTYTIRKN